LLHWERSAKDQPVEEYEEEVSFMLPKDELLKSLDGLTEKISSQIWTLNLGTLGTTWSLLIASSTIPEKLRFGSREAYPILILCLVTMGLDLAQYLAGYHNDKRILHKIEADGLNEFEYDTSSFLYRMRKCCFNAKIITAIIAALWLVVLLLGKIR
jgi:hypothetical protein